MFKSFVVSCVIAIITLVMVEIVLKLFSWRTHQYANPVTASAYVHSDTSIVALRPGANKTYLRAPDNGGDVIDWKVNDLGYRGEPLSKKDVYRVVVYGDSNIHARFTTLQNSFTERLESALGRIDGRSVEVVNAGVIGMGPDQNLLRMRAELGKLQPDFVVMHVFAHNDFGDVIRNRLFELDERGQLQRSATAHVPENSIERSPMVRIKQFVNSFRLIQLLRKFLRLPEMSSPEARMSPQQLVQSTTARLGEQFEIYRAGGPRSHSHFADPYDVDVAMNPHTVASKTKIDLLDRVLNAAHDEATRQGVGFIVLVQPSVNDLTENQGRFHREVLAQSKDYDASTLSGLVEQMCKSAAIPVLNLFDLFIETGGASLYFNAPNNHWNDHGQSVAATALAPLIRQNER